MYDHAGLKVHVMPCAFGGAEAGGWFAKEIKTKEDIKGLRMRIFGLGGRVMSRLGAITVLVPGGDLVAAFDKGKIDAAELYPPAVDARPGPQGQGQADLCAGLAPARDGARAHRQQGSLGRPHRSGSAA